MTTRAPDHEDSEALAATPDAENGQKCDFCGDISPSVRRVALDGDYERLRTPHAVMYSCSTCYEKKERQRLGIDRG